MTAVQPFAPDGSVEESEFRFRENAAP